MALSVGVSFGGGHYEINSSASVNANGCQWQNSWGKARPSAGFKSSKQLNSMPEAAEIDKFTTPLQPSHPVHCKSGTAQMASEKGTISCQSVLLVRFYIYMFSLFTHTLLFLTVCVYFFHRVQNKHFSYLCTGTKADYTVYWSWGSWLCYGSHLFSLGGPHTQAETDRELRDGKWEGGVG